MPLDGKLIKTPSFADPRKILLPLLAKLSLMIITT